ncbi:MAG: hypothetical protein HYZ49_18950 [Chloroflexi bacterium]|nr:hypothetical protein [Chloroflexota bacterium]
MFDDLRSRSSSPFEDDNLDEDNAPEAATAKPKRKKAGKPGETPILGLTAAQRLVLSIMLFLNIAVLGCFLLLAMGAVVPKF